MYSEIIYPTLLIWALVVSIDVIFYLRTPHSIKKTMHPISRYLLPISGIILYIKWRKKRKKRSSKFKDGMVL